MPYAGRLPHTLALFSLAALAPLAGPARSAGAPVPPRAPLLLQKPTVSRTEVAFSFAGDLWTVGREGGEARRLTSGVGRETEPYYSPDGSLVAFTGEYDGNVDVYVVESTGGVPRRLTFHPAEDHVAGWTPGGASVLFHSSRGSFHYFERLYTIPLGGGLAQELPLPRAVQGAYSPDGGRLAYVPINQWQAAWKRYRGGQTTPVWVADLADSATLVVPRENSNDGCPAWLGDRVYFLSDRSGPVSLFAYDTKTKQVAEVLRSEGLDFKWLTAGPDVLAYEQFGALFLYDPATGRSRALDVRLAGDFPEVRPRFVKVDKKLGAPALSPGGKRVAFEARGEILTVPAEKGDIRNLTRSPAAADRDPSWSADGQKLAWLSDESGEYALHVRDQGGLGEVKKIALGEPPSFFYRPRWSPDGKKIALGDKRGNAWYADLGKPSASPVKVDTDAFEIPDPLWSPDSKWLAYTKVQSNNLAAVFVYSLETGKAAQVTDGMSDARFPAWDRGGKHLYFAASTDMGPASSPGSMAGMNRPTTRAAYVVVLAKDQPSPLAPESDEEKPGEEKKEDGKKGDENPDGEDARAGEGAADGKEKGEAAAKDAAAKKDEKPPVVKIDLERIGQRTLALPVPADNYTALTAGKGGQLFLTKGPRVLPLDGKATFELVKFDLEKRKTETLVSGMAETSVAAGGEKYLYRKDDAWFIAATDAPAKAGEGVIKVAEAQVWVDPRAEWRQMYRETWRIQRDFLYDPGYHGLDLKAAEAKYSRWVDALASRADLNALFEEMLGELTLGHVFVGGGDGPEPPKVKGGLLGADFAVETGRYRFTRVFDGESWNPELRAPLTQPGVNVVAGEYLLAVNGEELTPPRSPYQPLEATAGKSVVLRVGPSPDGKGARDVNVVPVDDEMGLRRLAWIEGNRRKVDELSKGRLAYVYLPDTASGGYAAFNRYYFAQIDRQGAVLDERWNGGGLLADYVIDFLRREVTSYAVTREGSTFAFPAAIYGPKVMIVNESAGSGGDAMPWYFRKARLGTIVGTRTWGGLVGIGGYPALMDGGGVTAPRIALYGLEGKWEVENVGISPDVTVDLDPKLWRQGHDPQLEKAVEIALAALEKSPLPVHKRPPYPNYHPKPATTTAGAP
ncbi:MAG TPA: PDZ domain-containing protein [Vicinamibacteria bacterium]|nr:PDZ domain-containing protein [Vicinamibacteria bacterium]